MTHIIFNKEFVFRCESHNNAETRILTDPNELDLINYNDIIIYYVDKIKINDVISLIRIKKKYKQKIIICIEEINQDYLRLFEELDFYNICFRDVKCRKCLLEIEFHNEFIKEFDLLVNNQSCCYYTKVIFDKMRGDGFSVNLKSISAELGISLEHLGRIFKKDIGKTYREFINELKYKVSVSLSGKRGNNVSLVAAFLGFSEISNYYRFLKNQTKTINSHKEYLSTNDNNIKI